MAEANTGKQEATVDAATEARRQRDELYKYDEDHVELLDKEKPWATDPKYFKQVRVSALAAMKMLKHALSGVNRGQERGQKPLEVMGLMLGKPQGDSVIVMDCFPLPVEGTESKVVADDDQVHNYMINLSESLELTRKERFIGWYHSHPFDNMNYISTQLAWQRTLDPKWVAIVVDPLRSLAKQEPQFGAFRAYPPEYAPPATECPDGQLVADEKARQLRWGVGSNRYYQLEIDYFMSGLGSQLLDIMSRNHLWIRVLSSAAIMEPENRQRFPDRVNNLNQKLQQSEGQLLHTGGRGWRKSGSAGNEHLDKAAQAGVELAMEQCQGHSSQVVKSILFNPK